MENHRYILQPYAGLKTRHHCPNCQSRDKTFTFYIDTEIGEPLSDTTGRCERVDNCGYHYTPKQYFADNGINQEFKPYTPPTPKPLLPASFIDEDVFKKSLTAYDGNNFIKFLHTLFDAETVNSLIAKYFIGTSSHWTGANVFWQVDVSGNIRTGKIMLYNSLTGKRAKDIVPPVYWAHKALKIDNYKQCLFGEHLIKDETKPVAIVESEKTAIIASVYLPQFIWLACGGLQYLTAERCKVLAGRKVVLYPDLNAYDKWAIKAKELGFKISDILETNASEADRSGGLDIADYLIRTKAILSPITASNPKEDITPSFSDEAETPPLAAGHKAEPVPLLGDLNFDFSKLPNQPVRLTPGVVINNPSLFIDTHLATCQRNNGNKTYLPYYQRLQLLNQIINN